MGTGFAEYAYFTQSIIIDQAAKDRFHRALPQLFHLLTPFALLPVMSFLVLLVIRGSDDSFIMYIWYVAGF
jgi:hypothetical protein